MLVVDLAKVNPLIYVKLWKQACSLSLLFGAELWTFAPTLLLKLKRCEYWFLKHIFHVPKFAPRPLLLKLSGLNPSHTGGGGGGGDCFPPPGQ